MREGGRERRHRGQAPTTRTTHGEGRREGGRQGRRGERTCRTMSVFPLGSGTMRATVMVEFRSVLETKRS